LFKHKERAAGAALLLFLIAILPLTAGCQSSKGEASRREKTPPSTTGSLYLELRETAGIERVAETVRASIPFAAGVLLARSSIKILRSDGRELPNQKKVLSRWPDGSVRWLQIHFQPSVAAGAVGRYRVEYTRKSKQTSVPWPLLAVKNKGGIKLNSGRLLLAVDTSGLMEAWFDQNADGIYGKGEKLFSRPGIEPFVKMKARVKGAVQGEYLGISGLPVLEAAGPIRGTLRWSGWHVNEAGQRVCPFVLRLHLDRGGSSFRLVHTLVVSESPAQAEIAEAGIRLRLKVAPVSALSLRQELYKPGQYPDFFAPEPGFLLRVVGREPLSGKKRGFVELALGKVAVSLAVVDPLESSPWEISSDLAKKELTVSLWPAGKDQIIDNRAIEVRKPGGFTEFTRTESYDRYWQKSKSSHGVGAARTHQVVVGFHPGKAPKNFGRDMATASDFPLIAWPGIDWISDSGVFGRLPGPAKNASGENITNADSGVARLESWLRLHRDRKYLWSGKWDYGDCQTVFESHDDVNIGPRWWNWHGQWGWMQGRQGFVGSLLVPWLLSGEEREWRNFTAAVRHNMDVDTVHKCGQGKMLAVAGTTHGPGATHWSGPASLASTWPGAWLDLYYLAGDARGLETLRLLQASLKGKSVADFARETESVSSQQAGYIRARFILFEAFGKKEASGVEEVLGFLAGISSKELGRSDLWAREIVPALIRYHMYCHSKEAARLIIGGTRVCISSRGAASRGGVLGRNCYDSCAYAWQLSRDRYFLERGRQLAENSAAAQAARRKIKSLEEPELDLARDTRTVIERATLPRLEAALRSAGDQAAPGFSEVKELQKSK
jgi:PcRGLX-like protein central beta sandwich domain/PcRGLX-like N-terminal RIFT barrel domain